MVDKEREEEEGSNDRCSNTSELNIKKQEHEKCEKYQR